MSCARRFALIRCWSSSSTRRSRSWSRMDAVIGCPGAERRAGTAPIPPRPARSWWTLVTACHVDEVRSEVHRVPSVAVCHVRSVGEPARSVPSVLGGQHCIAGRVLRCRVLLRQRRRRALQGRVLRPGRRMDHWRRARSSFNCSRIEAIVLSTSSSVTFFGDS